MKPHTNDKLQKSRNIANSFEQSALFDLHSESFRDTHKMNLKGDFKMMQSMNTCDSFKNQTPASRNFTGNEGGMVSGFLNESQIDRKDSLNETFRINNRDPMNQIKPKNSTKKNFVKNFFTAGKKKLNNCKNFLMKIGKKNKQKKRKKLEKESLKKK